MDLLLFLSFYLGRNLQEDLSAASCWQQIYKWFSLWIWEYVWHKYRIISCFKKKKKKIKLQSNWQVTVSAQMTPPARAVLFEYMQSVRVENITFCRLYTNRLRPFQSSYSNQHQPPLPLLIGDMRCSTKHSLAVGACYGFCVFLLSFKYFHTADTFAALVRAYIWSCHVIVRYILYILYIYVLYIYVVLYIYILSRVFVS